MTRRWGWTLAVVGAATWLAAPAARQQPSFSAGTDLVSVYATVTDDRGRLVPDLTQTDFRVYDNGKLQPLTYFSNEPLPFSVVVMLDRSGSMAEYASLIRDAGGTFVRQMRPDDRARIGTIGGRIVIDPPEFTSDQSVLLRTLRSTGENLSGSPVWAAIDRAITALLPEPGRRVVLVFSDGHDEPAFARDAGITTVTDLVRRVRADDVMVYSIGFAVTEIRSVPQQTPGRGRPWSLPGRQFELRPAAAVQSRNRSRVRPPDPGLRLLADESGGGYFEMDPDSDLNATFARVADELHRQYWLGFAPQQLDGSLHKLEVKVRSGLKVRARQSYEASKKTDR